MFPWSNLITKDALQVVLINLKYNIVVLKYNIFNSNTVYANKYYSQCFAKNKIQCPLEYFQSIPHEWRSSYVKRFPVVADSK